MQTVAFGKPREVTMNNEPKKVVIYARVSSERQDVDLSISAQLKALREYAARNGYFIVREYVDEAESGRSIDRPGFKQMIVAARQKPPQFVAILVWKLSRFARNREDSIIYKSLLRKQGIQVISINEPVEDTPSGRLLEGIIEVIDEFYSANLSQDVVRGMRENSSRGFYSGGQVPYGYKIVKVKDGDAERSKLEPDPTTSVVVARIYRECVSGKGLVEIAQDLNKEGLTTKAGRRWGNTSLHTILRNEIYVGTLIWDKRHRRRVGTSDASLIRVEDACPAIVDRDTFDCARTKLASRAPNVTHPRVVHSDYILGGMIRCKHCDAAMIGHAVKSGKFFYYMCGNARRRGRAMCHTPLLPKNKIEHFVIDRIKSHILTEENLEGLAKLTNKELADAGKAERDNLEVFKAQTVDLENRLAKLYEALETGEFRSADLAPRIRALAERKDELEKARADLEEALQTRTADIVNPQVLGDSVADLRVLLEQSSIVKQKTFLRSFVKKIEVSDSDVKIIYTLPVLPGGKPAEVGVLPSVQNGSAYRIRTGGLFLEREVS
jgi:site-specific DNA recombinase